MPLYWVISVFMLVFIMFSMVGFYMINIFVSLRRYKPFVWDLYHRPYYQWYW